MSSETMKTLLSTAIDLVNGDRRDAYGSPEDSFTTVADLWNAYLKGAWANRQKMRTGEVQEILPHDVAALLGLLKVARLTTSPNREDNWLDMAGLAACGWSTFVALAARERNTATSGLDFGPYRTLFGATTPVPRPPKPPAPMPPAPCPQAPVPQTRPSAAINRAPAPPVNFREGEDSEGRN